MDTEEMMRYLREGKNDDMPEPSGDGGFLVPQPFADMIYASMRCQSSWLKIFRRIWRSIANARPTNWYAVATSSTRIFFITEDEVGYGDEPYDTLGYWIDDMYGDDDD